MNEPFSVTVEVPGCPTAKGRPRFNRVSGSVYTPKKTEKAEDFAKLCARQAMKGRGVYSGPCQLTLHILVSIPKSWPKAKKALAISGELRPTSRPDCDNYIKLICDAFNGIVYEDDCQIVNISAGKFYSETPATIAVITALNALKVAA